jgi:phenylacetate-CoA ligase
MIDLGQAKLALLDLAKHTRIASHFKFYLKTLEWDREKLVAYRNDRLRKLIRFSYENVPYYRRVMIERGIRPDQIKSAEDLAVFPVLDRDTVRREGERLRAAGGRRSRLWPGSSSGTTGIPVSFVRDVNGLSAGFASIYALWRLSGWTPGRRTVHIWGDAISIQKWNRWTSKARNLWMRQKNIPSPFLDDSKKIEEIAEKIVAFDPFAIEAYPSTIYTLAEYFQGKGLSLNRLSYILTSAENVDDYRRDLIERALGPIVDLYGCSEVLGIASRPVQDDKYYIFEPHVFVEAVDSGVPGPKEILVTDLDNYGQPFIRYRLGDWVDGLFEPEKGARYPLAYFHRVMGRDSEIIRLPNGKRIHPIHMLGGRIFRNFPEITRHKVIWDGKSLKIVLEVTGPPDERELSRRLAETLRPYDVPFLIEYTDKLLPSLGGKYKYVEIKK